MATKQPLKSLKPSPKVLAPAKKVSAVKVADQKRAAKKSESVKDSSKKNLKSATSAVKPAVKGLVAKKVTTQAPKSKTSVKKATDHTTKSGNAPVKSTGPVKTSSKTAAPQKTASDKKNLAKAAEVKHEDIQAVADNHSAPKNGAKQIIVPSKPAVNPKQHSGKKEETLKSNKPFVMPKTTTDKVVDYDPDFTKSVLDSPSQPALLPTMRYSDVELNEFKELINKKLDAAKKELVYLQGLITRKDEMGGDESDNRYMTMEDGSMSMEREQLSQMASRQITFIDHLEKAIMRIENKTYGICRVTGKLIDKARLRAVPHATLSMEAKLGIVK